MPTGAKTIPATRKKVVLFTTSISPWNTTKKSIFYEWKGFFCVCVSYTFENLYYFVDVYAVVRHRGCSGHKVHSSSLCCLKAIKLSAKEYD